MIRIAICDDHQIVREGLKQILSTVSDIEVAAEAVTGIQALDIARKNVCDVILLDISMPDQNGIDALRAIKRGQPDLPVLILSGFPSSQYAVHLFKMGVNGYLNKECESEELIKAIRTAANGRRYVNAEVGEILAQRLDCHTEPTALYDELSDREFQVFVRLAKGQSATEVALALSLSVKTISTYRTRVMEKLGLHSNSDLTYYAMKNNLIE